MLFQRTSKIGGLIGQAPAGSTPVALRAPYVDPAEGRTKVAETTYPAQSLAPSKNRPKDGVHRRLPYMPPTELSFLVMDLEQRNLHFSMKNKDEAAIFFGSLETKILYFSVLLVSKA